jgi:hypothetical protein
MPGGAAETKDAGSKSGNAIASSVQNFGALVVENLEASTLVSIP